MGSSRLAAGGLPWFTAAVVWTFLLQAALLVVLLPLTAVIGVATRRHQPAPQPWVPVAGDGDGQAPPHRWGLAGLGTPVVAMLAWLAAGGFGAGLALRTADFLGSPVAPGQPGPRGCPLQRVYARCFPAYFGPAALRRTDVDWQVMDPATGPVAGDQAWPRAYGHSDYFRDLAFAAARQLLEES